MDHKLYGRLIIPETFDNCLTYEEQVAYLAYHLAELEKKVEEISQKVLDTDP